MSIPILFNETWYLWQNPDVAQAVANGQTDARTHFLQHGQREGREASPLFNAASYLRDNPDVAAAVALGLTDPHTHFATWGWQEGRRPVPLFDETLYLAQNPDVALAVHQGQTNAVAHFLNYGISEHRLVNPAIHLGAYMRANPDAEQAAKNKELSALEHLLMYGITETRDLGNGISMWQFQSDPVFLQALASGDHSQALMRITAVAPFIPDFQRPAGWSPPANLPIPLDFLPPAGFHLQVPPEVHIPDGTRLPSDVFIQPDSPATPHPILQLTKSTDQIEGTDANDTVTGIVDTTPGSADSTLTVNDQVDGKGGYDTFHLKVTGDGNTYQAPAGLSIDNIQRLVLESNVPSPAVGTLTDIVASLWRSPGMEQLHLQASGTHTARTSVVMSLDMTGITATDIVIENTQNIAIDRAGRASFTLTNLASGTDITLLPNSGIDTTGISPVQNPGGTSLSASLSPTIPPGEDSITLTLGREDTTLALNLGLITLSNTRNAALVLKTPTDTVIQGGIQGSSLQTVTISGGSAGQSFAIKNNIQNATTLDATGLVADLSVRIAAGHGMLIDGGSGNDDLQASGIGIAMIDGGGGNDRIRGDKGNDELTGGAGSDTFLFGKGSSQAGTVSYLTEHVRAAIGTDTIHDFTLEDKLGLLEFLEESSTGSPPIFAKLASNESAESNANILVITGTLGNGARLDAVAVDILTSTHSNLAGLTPGLVLFHNHDRTELWFDQSIGTVNGANDVALIAVLDNVLPELLSNFSTQNLA